MPLRRQLIQTHRLQSRRTQSPRSKDRPLLCHYRRQLSVPQQERSGGVLLDTEGKPVSNIFVFLATVTPGPTLDAPIISFTLDSPKGSTDAKGQFVIKNVPAGIYSLAVWTPATNALIPPPNGKEGSAIQVEVINNRITDVGELRIVRPR